MWENILAKNNQFWGKHICSSVLSERYSCYLKCVKISQSMKIISEAHIKLTNESPSFG